MYSVSMLKCSRHIQQYIQLPGNKVSHLHLYANQVILVLSQTNTPGRAAELFHLHQSGQEFPYLDVHFYFLRKNVRREFPSKIKMQEMGVVYYALLGITSELHISKKSQTA